MAKTLNHYVLILCGGSGPRLWPLSRASKPKQFLKIFNDKSLLNNTILRFKKIVPATHIYIISNEKYLGQLKKDIGNLIPSKNIITEPEKRNTALAIIYGSSVINKINPEAVITSTPADHFIDNIDQFEKDLSRAVYLASHQPKIITLGIKPTSPNPAYGYIIPKNKKFIEKPDQAEAIILIKNGSYWNSGIYSFSFNTLINETKIHQPEYHKIFQQLSDSKTSPDKIYKSSPNLSFDVAISEKTTNLEMVPAKFIWSDIGQWKSIFQKLPKNESEMAILNKKTKYIQYNSRRCLISGSENKLIGLVGVNNLAVIDTPDGLLICNIDSEDSYFVREIVAQMVRNQKYKKFFLE